MRTICLVSLIVGCGAYEEKSEVGFITHKHVGRDSLGFLITKVHRPNLTVGYYFGDNCGLRPKEKDLRSDIVHSLRTWLSSIKDTSIANREIVDEFVVKNIQQRKDKTKNLDLIIKYTCGSLIPSKFFFGNPPTIVLRDGTELLHEMGHAFGLMDTYALANLGVKGDSYDYFPETIGNQPPSVMSGERFYKDPDQVYRQNIDISADDRNGMAWLYMSYYSRNKIDGINDCYFPTYELELLHKDGDKGCAPRNPLIFMFKNGYTTHQLRNRMIYDRTITPLVNKQEKTGDRLYPLHYAAMIPNDKGLHIFFGGDVYADAIIYRYTDINVTDRKGWTPLHYLIRAGNKTTIAYLIETQHWDEEDYSAIDLFYRLPNGMTYLHIAVQFAQVEAVCLLLKHNATDESLKDRWKLTSRQRAGSRLRYWERKENQQMVTRMKKIVSLFKDRNFSACSDINWWPW